MNSKFTIFTGCFLKYFLFGTLFLAGSASHLYAQVSDTTQTEQQELREEERLENSIDESETPYGMDLLESDINRYQLRDYGSSSRFYRQLEYTEPEELLMRGEEGYQRYGEEWERKINEDLMAIIRKTIKEDSQLMKLWKSIAPFIAIGIWEPYEVPITRVDYPDKVPVETIE